MEWVGGQAFLGGRRFVLVSEKRVQRSAVQAPVAKTRWVIQQQEHTVRATGPNTIRPPDYA